MGEDDAWEEEFSCDCGPVGETMVVECDCYIQYTDWYVELAHVTNSLGWHDVNEKLPNTEEETGKSYVSRPLIVKTEEVCIITRYRKTYNKKGTKVLSCGFDDVDADDVIFWSFIPEIEE